MCMTALRRPFASSVLLNLEMVSLSLCFLTFWIGAMLLDVQKFVWLVILCNVIGVIGLVGLFGKTKWEEKRLSEWFKNAISVGVCNCWKRGSNKGRRDSSTEMILNNEYSMLDEVSYRFV